jgi:hypothetical protein
MIPKGSQRGGGQQLATHLLNEFDNDRVELAQVRGAISPDLHGAFAEWRAVSRATKCLKYLYSLSLNPDPQQGPLTRDQYLDFISRAEKALGLSEQPRAIVFHVKYGREHCHTVWSRIDERTVKAVQLSHDHQSLRTVAREFARDHGLRLPRAMEKDNGRDRFKERQERENLAEQQQEERSGISKQERLDAITAAWQESKTAKELVLALEQRGYLLARGDKRAYVVVDRAGEIHSLARQIRGAKAKDVKARLADYPLNLLPDARKAQDFLRETQGQDRRESARTDTDTDTSKARREELARRQAQRRASLNQQKQALEGQHRLEAQTLLTAQKLENSGIQRRRDAARPRPIMAFLMRITGFGRIMQYRRERQDAQRALVHKRQRDALDRRHEREMVDFRHREHALSSVEARERRSLETRIRREAFQRAAGVEPKRDTDHPQRGLTPAQRAAVERFSQNAKDITKLRPDESGGGTLSRIFNDPDKKPEGAAAGKTPARERSSLSKTFDDAASRTRDTDAEEKARKLLEEFRRRAAQKSSKQEDPANKTPGRGPDRER